ncbi:MAG TPA: chloride channel protein [Steroidobacteraceae bacterium]|jgi:H+/Cl- antiporter ClcA/CBS domain-containing protein|nr:chloride channel protein [Steroidobacteraceae bacterium]
MSSEHLAPLSIRQAGDFAPNAPLLRMSLFAVAIGGISTLGADLLLGLIRLFTNLFYYGSASLANNSPAANHLHYWAALVPVAGGLLVGLLARYGSEQIRGHGIPEAIEAILFGRSRMSAKVAVLKPLSSGIVIGSGGPFGAEGPIIMTGGAAASLLAQAFHLTAAERKALLVAGACAGMTAVFGTPLAAILLAVELLLFELRPRSLMPVAISCAVAGFLRPLWATAGPLFPLETPAPSTLAMLSCCIAGLASGLASAAMTVTLYRVEDWFHRLPMHWMWWPAIGGVVVGLGGLLEPRALGVGYDVIGDLLANHFTVMAALVFLLVKFVMWAVALGSGTSGGVLAPLLMIGAGVGLTLSPWLPGGSPQLWALVCMSAILGGTMRAPLTAIVFAFGLTHDANAFLPTILGSAVAYGFTVIVMPRSILTEKIARRGRHVYREYSVDPLERHFVEEVMTRTVATAGTQDSVDEAYRTLFGAGQIHRAYPVLEGQRVVGMLDRLLIEHAMRLDPAQTIGSVLNPDLDLVFALPHENCRAIGERLIATGLERMPVVSDAKSLQLLGIVSRSDLLKPLKSRYEEEMVREGAIRFRT